MRDVWETEVNQIDVVVVPGKYAQLNYRRHVAISCQPS